MKITQAFHWISVLAILTIAFLVFGTHTVSALPPAPVPVSPAGGSTSAVPTFTWLAVPGAAKYELEVGPQSNPLLVYWSDQTVSLTLTPTDSTPFTNSPLYWRVRAYDSANLPGPWSSKINFSKDIPAPVLVSPLNTSTLINPVFEWQVVQGAAYYKVEISASNTFLVMEDTYLTYNTRLIPAHTITHGIHFWRVSSLDADGHAGTPSLGWSFVKDIPAPTLVSPYNGHPNIHVPAFAWLAVDGAAYYKVEVSTAPTFVPVEATYTTYNTSVTPVDSIPHGLHYWRVSSVDADGHVGTPHPGWSFTKTTDAPVLVSPGVNESVTTPTLQWQAVAGAAYYKVELSLENTFVPVVATYSTYNLQITPVGLLTAPTYYWRVSGVDAGGNLGNNNSRKFTLNAPFAATDVAPQLQTPAHAAVIDTDPTFSWTRVLGAVEYRLVISKSATFTPDYDSVITVYPSYTPYTAGSFDAYPNGTYYWKVEAHNGSHSVIATSAARSFSKAEALPLVGPSDGASALLVDPTFAWSQIVGAKTYRLVVSKSPSLSAVYDTVVSDYDSYTPSAAGSFDAYPNGTYYWQVEARNSGGTIIATSAARSLTKTEPLPLLGPPDGASALLVDPTFEWSQIVGAKTYRLVVSKDPSLSPVYDTVVSDYDSYTPYAASSFDAFPNGTYYWQVEARNAGGTIIATSLARSLTKVAGISLIAPVNNARLAADPIFQWGQIVGAKTYRLVISKNASFSPLYDTVVSDYYSYTPYTPGSFATYPTGIYYWKVEARNSAGIVTTTSSVWSFSKLKWVFLPTVIK